MQIGFSSIVSGLALASLMMVATASSADVTVTSSGGRWSITALDPEVATCPGGEAGTRFAYTCTGGEADHAYLSFLTDAVVCDAQPQPVTFSFDGEGDSKTDFGEAHASRQIARFNPNALNCSFEVTVVGTVGAILGDTALSKGKKFEFAAIPVPQGEGLNPFAAPQQAEIKKFKGCVYEVERGVLGEITGVNILSGNCVSDSLDQNEFGVVKVDANGNPTGPAQGNLFADPNTELAVGGETGSTFYMFDGRRWIRITDCQDPTDPRPPCP